MKRMIPIVALAAVVAVGCTGRRYEPPKDADLVQVSYDAAQALQRKLKQPLPKNSMIVVSTFVNTDNLKQTSSFGRIVSDQIASAFNNSGYRIRGMEMPTDLFVKQESGFLYLTDEAKEALLAQGADALVVGVFAPGEVTAYVSVRMVDVESQTVISSTDFSVPMGPDTQVLLRPRELGNSLTGEEPSSSPAY